MSEVVALADHQEPVSYTVRLREYYDGRLTIWVQDVQDDERSRKAVADALRRAADAIEGES